MDLQHHHGQAIRLPLRGCFTPFTFWFGNQIGEYQFGKRKKKDEKGNVDYEWFRMIPYFRLISSPLSEWATVIGDEEVVQPK